MDMQLIRRNINRYQKLNRYYSTGKSFDSKAKQLTNDILGGKKIGNGGSAECRVEGQWIYREVSRQREGDVNRVTNAGDSDSERRSVTTTMREEEGVERAGPQRWREQREQCGRRVGERNTATKRTEAQQKSCRQGTGYVWQANTHYELRTFQVCRSANKEHPHGENEGSKGSHQHFRAKKNSSPAPCSNPLKHSSKKTPKSHQGRSKAG
ncbi:hypothetical protein ACOSQ4_002606 [Xanthoceras sorbifolium]